MTTIITNFANNYIRFGNGLIANTVAVVNAYIAFNGGSTQGKLKLYAYLQSIEGVSKVRSEFHGMELIQPPQPAAQPAAQQTQQPLSAYELKCIQLKELKIEEARKAKEESIRLETLKIEEARKMEELKIQEARKAKEESIRLETLKIEEARKMEERKLNLKEMKLHQQRDIEMMKIQFKSECFNRSMEFQREVNNQNRYMNAGFINRKTEYVVLGTASNVHIEYDSAIDNLNELEYKEDIKEPIKQCFKDQAIDLKMIDEKIEKAIPLKAMINIHQLIIGKLDSNELSDEIKQKIMEEFENEEYTEVKTIINDLDVSQSDTNQYIEISSNEITRLKEIEKEARLYARVHTKSYNRCLEENNKMSEKIGRKSMLPAIEYVVSENNVRCLDGNIVVDCFTCSKTINIKDAHRSHIVAKELGGSCDKDNIRICCKQCNLDMGIMDLFAYKASKL